MLMRGSLTAGHRNIASIEKELKKAAEKHAEKAAAGGQLELRAPLDVLGDVRGWWLVTLLALAIVGTTVDHIYFCFHLLDIVTKSSELMKIMEAVTSNT
jgi:hypothetical protein